MQGSHINRARAGLATAVVAAGALGISACGSSSSQNSSSGLQTGTQSSNGAPTGKSTVKPQSITSASSTSTASNTTTTTGGAPDPGKNKPKFILGDKNFPEEYVLGYLYQLALQDKGYKVSLKPNIGSTEVTYKALKSGQIDGYPEYDGTLLASEANDSTMYTSAAAAAKATDSFAAKQGDVFTNITPFSDSDAIAVTSKYASTHHLSTIADLKQLGKTVVLAGAPEFATRYPDGLPGLEKIYKLTPTFKPTSIGDFYSLLDSGSADAIAAFTTDPQLKGSKYKVLTDTKAIFGYQNVGIVANAKLVRAEGPAFTQTINQVSALLTQKAIIALNAAVELDKQSPAKVAYAFLLANHLE